MSSLPLTREELRAAMAAGKRFKFLFFWGHRPSPDGLTGSCLSQWWASPFVVDNQLYITAEHWMMAEKARLFGDTEAERRILAAASPGEAKKIGREVRNFNQETWNEQRFNIVVDGSRHKFGQNAELERFLLGTHQRVLVEASPRDCIWGIGLGARNPKASDPAAWRGKNLLGFALMVARESLMERPPVSS